MINPSINNSNGIVQQGDHNTATIGTRLVPENKHLRTLVIVVTTIAVFSALAFFGQNFLEFHSFVSTPPPPDIATNDYIRLIAANFSLLIFFSVLAAIALAVSATYLLIVVIYDMRVSAENTAKTIKEYLAQKKNS